MAIKITFQYMLTQYNVLLLGKSLPTRIFIDPINYVPIKKCCGWNLLPCQPLFDDDNMSRSIPHFISLFTNVFTFYKRYPFIITTK